MEYPEKPPPSYDETFPEVVQNSCTSTADSERGGNDDENNSTSTTDLLFDVENALKFVSNIDVITVPVLTQLLSSDYETSNSPPTKKYIVLDHENGAEIFHCLDISGRRGDPNIRGITLTLPPPGEKSVLHCGYLYSPTFSTLEFSSPTGRVGVFQRDGFGMGLLCPCICLCCCLPIATASIKSCSTGEPLLVGNAYLFPRKIDISRPSHLGGFKIGSVNVGEIHLNQSVQVKLEECASPNEKLLVIGLAVGMMDYEQFHKARGGYGYQSMGSS
ncbi:uncharacterized protein LOC110844636 [Folsomia candida]|uniref:uncharacterized protein LOC110844636 n=1 Tax=Folsomia candida TaxID=158441 RepID=UPI000B904F71|nr:uncharacterized protein LOC110844636 [Folsomia candida]